MKRGGIVVTAVFALLALGVGFGGTTVALNVTQPAIPGATATIHFTVKAGDTTNSVASRLQQEGIIRYAVLFRLLARYRHLDTSIEQGVYELSPNMSMNTIISKLQTGKPDEQLLGVPEALRVTQYPAYFSKSLPNFNSANFLQIAKTGKLMDGTPLWQKYWYVMPPTSSSGVKYVLEGYLYPDYYYFNSSANEQNVVEVMLQAFGEHFCPGPDGKPDAYIYDQAQCKAHAVTVGKNNLNIFTAMEQKYFTTDDRLALHRALTLGSIVMREILHFSDAQGVANVYYNRYLISAGKLPSGVTSDVGTLMQADPTVQYAYDSASPPPSGGKWWRNLNANDLTATDANDPYNTYTHPGLPPGPISAPLWKVLAAAAYPNPNGPTQYFYFLSDKCGTTHYASTNADFEALKVKYIDQAQSYQCAG